MKAIALMSFLTLNSGDLRGDHYQVEESKQAVLNDKRKSERSQDAAL